MVAKALLTLLLLASPAEALTNIWEPRPEANACTNTSPTCPTTRGWQMSAYDPVSDKAMVFGGSDSEYQNDVVEITGLRADLPQMVHRTIHRDLTPGAPRGRDGHQLVWAKPWNRFVLFGGWSGQTTPPNYCPVGTDANNPAMTDVCTWDPTTGVWSRVPIQGYVNTDGAGLPYALFPDGRSVLSNGGRSPQASRRWYRTTFNPDGTGTRTLLLTNGPEGQANFSNALTYVASLGKFAYFWGATGVSRLSLYDPITNTWTEVGNSTQLGFPPYRQKHSLAYEPRAGVVVLHAGGELGAGPQYHDTWVWHPTTNTWELTSIPPRSCSFCTLIAVGDGVLWSIGTGPAARLELVVGGDPPPPPPPTSYPLSVETVGAGRVIGDFGDRPVGSTARLYVLADPGATLSDVTGDCDGLSTEYALVMDGPKTCTFTFTSCP